MPKMLKSYVKSMPAQKNIEVPKNFMAFLRTLAIAFTIQVRIMSNLLLPSAEICHQLKAIHNTTKYAP